MGKLLRLTINLSSTPLEGRYTLTTRTYNIENETEKTLTIGKPTQRVLKNLLLLVESDFANNTPSRIQFKIWALEEDCDKAIKLLEEAVERLMWGLSILHDNAQQARQKGLIKLEEHAG